MKKLVLLLFLAIFFFSLKSDVFAQGTYTCVWKQLLGECQSSSNCTQGYQPGDECGRFNKRLDCINAGSFPCERTPTPTPTTPPPPPPPPPDGGCDDPQAIPTAIGCISTEPSGFVASILNFAIIIGGAVAFLLIIFGAFQILTSSGTPEKVQAGKELITSAIAGLLLIIFAVFILRLIGAEILKIPGFE